MIPQVTSGVLRIRGYALPEGEPIDLYADGDRWTTDPVPDADVVSEGWILPGWSTPTPIRARTSPATRWTRRCCARTCSPTSGPGSLSSGPPVSPTSRRRGSAGTRTCPGRCTLDGGWPSPATSSRAGGNGRAGRPTGGGGRTGGPALGEDHR